MVAAWALHLATAAVVPALAGCSFTFMKGAPATEPYESRAAEPVQCTRSRAAPIVDTAIAAYQVFRTGTAISLKDIDYAGAPFNRSTDIGLGIALTGLFAASAIYGYASAAGCDAALEADSDLLPGPTDSPPQAPTNRPESSACVPGATVECAGPGACRGGQVCERDGTRYGTCDCGR